VLAEIATAVLIPGWSVRRRLPLLAIALFAAGTLTPLAVAFYALFSGRNWVALTLDAGFLAWVMTAGVAAVLARLIAVAEVWLSIRPEYSWKSNDVWAITIVLAVVVPLTVGVVQVGRARASIEPAFAGQTDLPLFDSAMTVPATSIATSPVEQPTTPSSPVATTVPAEFLSEIAPRPTTTSTSTTTTTLPPKPERPRSGVDPTVVADVTNVLLLGGDAGPGRSGLRTDTMMLFSLHKPSGRAALISIPRNL